MDVLSGTGVCLAVAGTQWWWPSRGIAMASGEANTAALASVTRRVVHGLTWYGLVLRFARCVRLDVADSSALCFLQVKALEGKTVIQAACGGSHTLFVTSDGIAYVAGRPEYVAASFELPSRTSLC
jgi:hypothetical protein